jgi:D-lactate dehydrogenase
MRIAFFELEGWENRTILHALQAHEVYLSKEKLTAENLPPDQGFEAISVFVDSRIDRAVLGRFPKLKLIATRSTGYDHIDVAACRERNIVISFVPGYGDNTVAEFTFGLLLSLVRKIYEGIDRVKETGSFSIDGLRGIDLLGRTIGVIGTGRIGKQTMKIAHGFGMRIIGYDPHPEPNFARETGCEYRSLEELLRISDVISMHCLLTPETRHLINKSNVALIKRGAYLVNTARGAIVSTEALVYALQEGILAGAALDVLEEEGETKDELRFLASGHPQSDELATMLRNHILMKMPNVLITPHLAFNSVEALQRILNTSLMSIRSFTDGQPINTIPTEAP